MAGLWGAGAVQKPHWGRGWGPGGGWHGALGRGQDRGEPPGGERGSRACSALRARTCSSSSTEDSDWISWHASTLIWERKKKYRLAHPPERSLPPAAPGWQLGRGFPAQPHQRPSTASPQLPLMAALWPAGRGPAGCTAKASCPARTQQGGLCCCPSQRWSPQTTAKMEIPIGGARVPSNPPRASGAAPGREGEAMLAVPHTLPRAKVQQRGAYKQWKTARLQEVADKGVPSLKTPASNSYCCLGLLP